MTPQTSLGNILIVDHDPVISNLLEVNLRGEGYNVHVKADGNYVDLVDLRNTQLVLIDCAEQQPNGYEIIAKIKSSSYGERIGVIYCSAYTSENDLVKALDAGADDCVRKPFSLRELMARVRSVMRRRARMMAAAKAHEIDVVRLGDMRIDLHRKSVTIGEEFVNLSNTEFAILELLIRNANTYTSRIEIFRKVWPEGTGANERIVDTNISRLRRKLGDLGSFIANRSGLGYMIQLKERTA